jgi:hypothetical protein
MRSADGDVIQFELYQQKVARQRRRAWWDALLFGARPDKSARKSVPVVRDGVVVKFRKQAVAARW